MFFKARALLRWFRLFYSGYKDIPLFRLYSSDFFTCSGRIDLFVRRIFKLLKDD